MTIAAIMPQLQRAQAMLQAGQAPQAWMVLAPLRHAIDGEGQALRLYALTAQAVGRIDEAASALERIAGLEKEPPEILGALADMLGNAGRHDEALGWWTRMAESHPEIADAHLNRAVTAANAGRHDAAIGGNRRREEVAVRRRLRTRRCRRPGAGAHPPQPGGRLARRLPA